MQINSFIFILLFLPVTAAAYFCCNKAGAKWGKAVLVLAGFVFYGYAGTQLLPVLLLSLVLNYCFARLLRRGAGIETRDEVRGGTCGEARGKTYGETGGTRGRWITAAAVGINVGLLFYFKYLNFAALSLNRFLGTGFTPRQLLLPLGISFFTFQQIAYVVSVQRGEVRDVSLLDYLVYILYFPKLVMGPLMEPADFLKQINAPERKNPQSENMAIGLKLFSFGLFKKMMLADVFAKAVAWGFGNPEAATSLDLVVTALCYTFEIYFDFSGYTDMASGVSYMLNIELPINFDSPYKALNIRDFWKRWHMSLTGFFTKYIYIPLGGSRKGAARTYANTMLVFLVSGIWHGANGTFILWGLLHGALMVFDRIAGAAEEKLPRLLRWLCTFAGLQVLWLLFRADSVGQWVFLMKKVLTAGTFSLSAGITGAFALPEISFLQRVLRLDGFCGAHPAFWMLLYLGAAFGICLIPENNMRNAKKLTRGSMVLAAVAFVLGFLCLGGESVFVYFNF